MPTQSVPHTSVRCLLGTGANLGSREEPPKSRDGGRAHQEVGFTRMPARREVGAVERVRPGLGMEWVWGVWGLG